MTDLSHPSLCSSAALLMGGALSLAGLPAAALDTDGIDSRRTVVVRDTPLELYSYRPGGAPIKGLLLALHGQRRNAADYRDYARELATRHGLLLVAPHFDRQRFNNRRYQRGGISQNTSPQAREAWTVHLIPDLIQTLRRHEGNDQLPVYLFGHSAGGQFLSRVAAFAEIRDARRIIVANPSSHVLADLDEAAPYGLGGLYPAGEGRVRLARYLASPLTIYLGGEDTRQRHLHQHPAAQRQGRHRLERGQQVYQRAAALADELDMPFNWQLVIAPEIRHSARGMLASPRGSRAGPGALTDDQRGRIAYHSRPSHSCRA